MYPLVADKFVPGTRFEELVDTAIARGLYYLDEDPDEIKRTRLEEHRNPSNEGYLIHLRDGRWIMSRQRRTEDGGIVGIRADVTKLKQVEEALRESEVRFAQAAQLVNLGHWVYDRIEDRLIDCSDEIPRMHGVTKEAYLELVSSTESDV